MNKKGAYFHWVVLFGVLGAIALFLMFGKADISSAPNVKGEWQMDFLRDNYLGAEKDLLEYDVVARKIGIEVIKEIAENGGYEPGQISDCWEVDGFNLWNTEDTVCFPLAEDAADELADKKVKEKLPKYYFSNVGFSGSIFTGKGEKAEIITDIAKYVYETGFAVDVGYSFEEYEDLNLDAAILISTCWSESDLKKCLDENKDSWKYSFCKNENYQEDSRKVPFCVDVKGIQHKFALDFTALPPSLAD